MSHRLLFFLFLLAACSEAPRNAPRAAAPAVTHSRRFANAVDSTMDAYYRLTEAFVNWDSVSVQSSAGALQNRIGRLITEVVPGEKNVQQASATALLRKVDGSLEQIRSSTAIAAQRQFLNEATRNMFDFLEAVQWSYSPVYLQECPMAFNEQDTGYWLSRASEIRNPYFGLHHPTYGHGMLGCGDTQDSVQFQPAK